MDDDSFLFYSSSHNFQSLTGICENSHVYFLQKNRPKIKLISYVLACVISESIISLKIV
ncbi:hypothetical protein LEP1GSC018_2378 [Leptospira kirschneri str. 2008720114]|nr:hypothetical protein LEP1GSC018_2378 [Leptospira kirschneri str. 2008720114]